MAATTPPPPPAAPGVRGTMPTLDVSGTRPVPFWRLVLIEFRKSYDTRAGFWLLFTIGLLVALVETAVMVAVLVNESRVYFGDFTAPGYAIATLLLPVLAIMLVTSEWSQRTAMVSFSLEPRRLRVIWAKFVVGIVWALATVTVMFTLGAICTGVCELIQPDLTEWDGEWWIFLALVAALSLTMTIGFAIAALLLNTPASIVVFFLYWYLLPIVLFAIAGLVDWFEDVLPWIHFQAALDPVFNWNLDTAEELGQLLTATGLWIVLPLAVGIWRIHRAEVK